jgi:hypothetical protein
MKNKSIPVDTVAICVSLSEDGSTLTQVMDNFSKSYPIVEKEYLHLLLKGLEFIIHTNPDFAATVGNLTELLESKQVEFEADDELKDAISDAKVIPINKNRMN